jgi:hypothetical protein
MWSRQDAGERDFLGDGSKVLEMPEFHLVPIIS